MKKPRILKVQKDSSNPWFEQIRKTVSFPGESENKMFYSIKPSDYVSILAQTPDEKIIIVRQYRPAIEDYVYELPSGHLKEGETPEQAAIRELREETGCIAKSLLLLGKTYPDTGRLENRQWAFFSNDVEVRKFPNPEENERIEVYLVTLAEFFQMINNGEFRHSLDLSVIALACSGQYMKVT